MMPKSSGQELRKTVNIGHLCARNEHVQLVPGVASKTA